MPPKPSLGFAIITLNEESHIKQCIESIPSGFPVVVVDSGSQDQTTSIAAALGAQITEHKFTNYSEQKNFAASLLNTDWVFSLDADEVLSHELRTYIESNAISSLFAQSDGLKVARHLKFLGRTLKYGRSRDFPLKIFRRNLGQFQGTIHEQITFNHPARISYIPSGWLLHDSFENLEDYFKKFNHYTSIMATQRARKTKLSRLLTAVFRPWWEFFYRYFIRLGLLDGFPGYTYALISSLYAFTKYAKSIESHPENSLEPNKS